MIVGVEALIRWQHPERGLVPPSQFLPIAEDCGLILPIGRWVLREACSSGPGLETGWLAADHHCSQYLCTRIQRHGFSGNIRATLEETDLEPRYLELELTESVLMRDAEFTNSMLHGSQTWA